MIKNIVFDMGNVLLEWVPENIVGRFVDDKDRAKLIADTVFEQEMWNKYDRSEISEDEIRKIAKDKLGDEYAEDIDEVLDNWQYCLPINEKTNHLLKYFHHKGFGVYMLTNANKKFLEIKRDLHVIKYMNGYLASYEVGCAKPDEKFYNLFLNKFDLKAEECLLIDDLVANCDGARKVGMTAVLFDGDYDHLIGGLKYYGLDV
jgi:putative hydrolase of the HAD superfamily